MGRGPFSKSFIQVLPLTVSLCFSSIAFGGFNCKPDSFFGLGSYICDPPPPPKPAPPPVPPPPNQQTQGASNPIPPPAFGEPGYNNTPDYTQTAPPVSVRGPAKPPPRAFVPPDSTVNNSAPSTQQGQIDAPPDIPLNVNSGTLEIPGGMGNSLSTIAPPPPPAAPPVVTNINAPANNIEREAEDSCVAAAKQADDDCKNGGTAGKMATAAQVGASGIAAGDGGAYSACKSMEAQSYTALGGTAGVYEACTAAVRECVNACESLSGKKYSDNATRCQSLTGQIKMGALSAIGASVQGLEASSQCKDVIKAQEAGLCTGANASTFMCNPVAFCQSNKSSSQCAGLINQCNGSAAAQGNALCAALAGAGINTNLPNTDSLIGNEGQNTGYAGYDAKAHNPQGGGDSPNGGGGGFGGGGSPGGSNGGPGAGAGKERGLNIDIGGATGSGMASGTVTLGNPAEENGHHRVTFEGDELDLSQFLPNGEMAQRNLANVNELLRQGVTGVNDLTNFEKITRMMNQKRKYLAP